MTIVPLPNRLSLVKMIAPSSVAGISGNDAAGKCPVASKICAEMARVVSFSNSDASPRTSSSITLSRMPVASPSGAINPRRESHGSAVNAPIFKSDTLPPAVGSETKVAVLSANSHPELVMVTDSCNGNAAKEAGSIVFHRSRAGRIVPKNRKCSANSVSGRWTPAEHETFLKGLKVYGREWKKVARCVPTRTSAQIRSHAQKYFAKVSKEQQHLLALTEQRRSFTTGIPSKSDNSLLNNVARSQSFMNTINFMVSNPSAVESRVCKTLALLRKRYKQLQHQLKKKQAPAPVTNPQLQSGEAAPLGPASAALEVEQTSLLKAAATRYEAKTRDLGNELMTNEANGDARTCVSVTPSPSSYGIFDSSDVIALSRLGGHLGRDMLEDKNTSNTEGACSLKLARERQRPTKLRKLGEDRTAISCLAEGVPHMQD